MQFWIFNFSANPDILYIHKAQNLPLNLRSSGYSIFLQIQTFRTYIMYRIFRRIFEALDIQFFCKTRHSVHISRTQFPFNFHSSGYSKFLQIQTFRTYYVYNFSFNLRSSRHSISLQIKTFCTYITYTIFRWIYAVLDIQFFC